MPVTWIADGAICKGVCRQRTVLAVAAKLYVSKSASWSEMLISKDPPRESGSCRKRQKPQAQTPQAPVRNRQTRKVANAKCLNRNTNLT